MKLLTTALFVFTSIVLYAQDFKLVIKENDANIIMLDYDGHNGQNVFFGKEAGLNSTDASSGGNTFIGRWAGRANTDGFFNTYLGKSAGESAVGNVNTYVGNQSGEQMTGDRNIIIGNSAGQTGSGNYNVFIGEEAGRYTTGSRNLFLGSYAGSHQQGNNQLAIETASDSDSTEMLIYGQFDNDILRFNAHTDIYSDNASDEGLFVQKTHSGLSDIPAIKGENTIADFFGIGVQGHAGFVGVDGEGFGTQSGTYFGVRGQSQANNSGINIGLFGNAIAGATNYGIYGLTTAGNNNYAAFFNGTTKVLGLAQDSVHFKVENSSGENQLSVNTGEVVIDNLTTTGTTELEIESGKKIRKATSMKYYIALEGVFPSEDVPISDQTYLGEIRLFPYPNIVPGGWHECDGSLLPIIDHQALFSLLALEYGGNGTTTFGIPDMREAVPHHAP